VKVYRQHRVWTDMYELSVTLESVLHVWSSDAEEQLLEAHRVTVGESERFKAVLGADFGCNTSGDHVASTSSE